MAASKDEAEKVQGTSLIEWFVAIIGGLILLATVSFLVMEGLTRQEGPPQITFEAGRVEAVNGGYVVPFTARNQGYSTASALEITARLVQGGAVVEESRATIDHVPEQSVRRGGVFFSRNPEQFELQLRAAGYSSP
jgi:uncharacterized protein (TIGR02588 family)